jgi:hypothetical protein
MRIPRRGEVGWQGEEIERLESLGYVMSGKEGGREGGRKGGREGGKEGGMEQ